MMRKLSIKMKEKIPRIIMIARMKRIKIRRIRRRNDKFYEYYTLWAIKGEDLNNVADS
jgi:hypothetical protein